MLRSSVLIIVYFVFLIASSAIAEKPSHAKPQKTQVRFLAASTLVRGSWGYNQDIYLAEFQIQDSTESILARLIDEYPHYVAALSTSVLQSESGTIMTIRRDADCDLPYGQFLLRAAPGDLMAILPIKLSYRPQLSRTISEETQVPCYRVVRHQ